MDFRWAAIAALGRISHSSVSNENSNGNDVQKEHFRRIAENSSFLIMGVMYKSLNDESYLIRKTSVELISLLHNVRGDSGFHSKRPQIVFKLKEMLKYDRSSVVRSKVDEYFKLHPLKVDFEVINLSEL